MERVVEHPNERIGQHYMTACLGCSAVEMLRVAGMLNSADFGQIIPLPFSSFVVSCQSEACLGSRPPPLQRVFCYLYTVLALMTFSC